MIGKIVGTIMLSILSLNAAKINNLFSDHRAMVVGDILTVYIVENAKAGSNSSSKTDNKNSLGINGGGGTGALGFVPSMGMSGEFGNSYEGKGATQREGSLVAKLSARVGKVYDNGNLLIEGNKTVEINDETEVIKLTGVVRPQDIESDNIIYSYNIANAEITYSGKGEESDARRAGPLTRFFNWLF